MRRTCLILLLVLLYLIAPWFDVIAQQQGDRITEPYKAGTLSITARFADGDFREGFGFIVGERNRDLFLVTANHIIEKKPDSATTIEVRFSTAPDEPYQAKWLKSNGPLDLALLKIDKPDFAVPWQQAAWCTQFKRGDKVWFIGRDRDWFVPLDREAGELYASEPDLNDRLQFAISSVKPGTSGAPLIHQKGIVGMITRDRVNNASAVAVNKIRRFVQGMNYPWQLRRCGDAPDAVPAVDTPSTTLPDKIDVPAQLNTFRDRLKDGGEGPLMVMVPKGCFRMGAIQGGEGNEQPVHQVCLDAFAVGVTEVTFDEYDRFANATGHSKPNDMGWGRGKRPVIKVTWTDAFAYTVWLTEQTGKFYHLPTEAQWEYTARAGTETRYWWGNKIGRNRANCNGCGSRWDKKQTAPVASFERNPFGLYDTAGNVLEWTCSEYAERYDGRELSCVYRNIARLLVIRGGSWASEPWPTRTANRDGLFPEYRGKPVLGFRVVRLASSKSMKFDSFAKLNINE